MDASIYRPQSRRAVALRDIKCVFFHEGDVQIRVQVQWSETDPDTGRFLRASTVPVPAFAHAPQLLLNSAAWRAFLLSDAYAFWEQHCPAAFDIQGMLGLRAASRDRDTVMEWQLAKRNTYSSVADTAACPVCFDSFDDDAMVSWLPCRHIMCIRCTAMCSRCPMRSEPAHLTGTPGQADL